MISTGFGSAGRLLTAGGKREKEVHTGTGVIVGPLLRPVPLNPTILSRDLVIRMSWGPRGKAPTLTLP